MAPRSCRRARSTRWTFSAVGRTRCPLVRALHQLPHLVSPVCPVRLLLPLGCPVPVRCPQPLHRRPLPRHRHRPLRQQQSSARPIRAMFTSLARLTNSGLSTVLGPLPWLRHPLHRCRRLPLISSTMPGCLLHQRGCRRCRGDSCQRCGALHGAPCRLPVIQAGVECWFGDCIPF